MADIFNLYRKHYLDFGFERAGLFQLVQENYPGTEALYPGSYIHIAPSFYFPHVVYIDTHPEACAFFAEQSTLLHYIHQHKKYRRSSYVRFIAQDFTTALPLAAGQFEFLISLYAGGVARACKKYLKSGGILLSNNFQNDACEAAADPDFQLSAVICRRQEKYSLRSAHPESLLSAAGTAGARKYVRHTARGIEYTDNEDYFVFIYKNLTGKNFNRR